VKFLKKGGALSVLVVAAILFMIVSMGVTEETPLGSVAGTLKMSENGAPLSGVAVILTPLYSDGEEAQRGRVTYSDKLGNFIMSGLATGSYKIEANAKVHTLPPTDVIVREGGVSHLDLELNPEQPSLNLYTSQRVFTPDETPEVEAHGFGDDKALAIKVYKIDLSKFLAKGSIYGVLYSVSNSEYRTGEKKSPADIGKLVDSFSHQIKNYDSEGSFIDVVSFNQLHEGFYWVTCNYGKLEDGAFINISKLGLVTKSSPGKVLAFVTDLKTGEPVPGAQISYNDKNKWAPAGTTDRDGLMSADLPGKGRKLLVLATHGASQAVSAFYLYGTQPTTDNSDNDYEGGEDNGGGPAESHTTIFVYTDRPIYRPGDDIQFKGFARTRVGSQYNLPGPGKVHCELRDLDDNLVKSFDVAMDANGAFHGDYQSNAEDSPGQYTFNFSALGNNESTYFTLAAYRKPEFTIKVTWSKSHYTMGEKLKATVKCEYYFGGPVAGAKLDATLFRNQDWYQDEWDSDDYDVANGAEDEGGGVGGDYVDESSGVTDSNGEAVFEFDAKPDKKSRDLGFTPNYIYTLSADVTEAGDKYFSGQGSVKVSQGAIDIKVDPSRYIVQPGNSVDVQISAFKTDDRSPAAGRTLQVSYGTEEWSRRTDYNNYKWEPLYSPEGNLSVKTGADGIAHFNLPATRLGSYTIRASAIDEQGNTIVQTGYVYCGTDDFVPPPTNPDLSLTLDKKLYQPGNTCEVLIAAAKPGLTALLTVEAEDVMYKQVVRIEKQSKLVKIPVLKSYLPRVTLSVVAVQNKHFLETSEALKVDVTARTLGLQISSDRAQYLPGSIATYKIHATGADGKPAAADLSLGVVDEAIYALQEDHTNPIRSFYPARQDVVGTNYSFPELYLDGGDKGGEVPVRMNFKDTAAWVPSIKTDTNGDASLQVKLPDNLTKWRATVIGVSDATDVGLAKYDVVVNKPLMIRLEGPKFMVNGDHQDVAAVITNNTGADADIHVSLQPSGFSTSDAVNQTLHISTGQSGSISWNLLANTSGPGSLIAKAWIDHGANDGVEQKIDIKPHARQVEYMAAGDIRGSTKFKVVLRDDADPTAGRLKLSVSPTMGTGLYNTLDELIGYPYGCVEQTMSRFMPSIVASSALKQVHLLRPDLAAEVPEITAQSVAKLKNMQHTDGGWGWWENDDSDAFMTAYVLDGLHQAKMAGYKISPFMSDRAVEWASKEILSVKAKKWPLRDRLYLGYELAVYGKKDVAAKVLDSSDLRLASAPQIATAALLTNELGKKYELDRDQLIDQLRSMATEEPMLAHWNPRKYKLTPWWEIEDVYGAELDAIPLLALEEVRPNDPLIEKGVRNLMMTRNGDWWWSTRDSSFAVMAICKYLSKEDAPQTGSTVHVVINGKEIQTFHLDINDLRQLAPTVVAKISDLKRGANEIELRSEGAKLLYYSVDFTQFATAPTLGKLVNQSGLTIERTYHTLKAQQMEDGTLKMQESSAPVTSIKSGDLIQCDLVINSDRDRNYVMMTDPLPSNCHPEIDNSADFSSDSPWDYWYANQTVYDDRVTFFSTHLSSGKHVITYILRAESPGISHALPPTAGNMYNPQDKASDAETELEVTR